MTIIEKRDINADPFPRLVGKRLLCTSCGTVVQVDAPDRGLFHMERGTRSGLTFRWNCPACGNTTYTQEAMVMNGS